MRPTNAELRERLQRYKKDERHATRAETAYWCAQYKQLAEDALAPPSDSREIPESWATHGGLWIEALYKHQRGDNGETT